MHILINMNYIGFYLCYLHSTAKLINVLLSVLTQLFSKVTERYNAMFYEQAQEGGDMGTRVCIWLIRFVVQQKLKRYCETIILQ